MSNSLKTIETIAQTPEAVAYQLMTDILRAEGKGFGSLHTPASRGEMLATYRACLDTIRNNGFEIAEILHQSKKAA